MASHPSPGNNHQSTIGQSERTQGQAKIIACNSFITYVLGLSTLSNIKLIDTQSPLSLLCCSWPPSHHLSSPTSVSLVPTLHLLPLSSVITLLAIRCSSILSTCPNHLNTHWSALLANSLSIPALLHSSSFLTLSIHDTNQTSQTPHLKNIHFPSLSTSHTPCLCSIQCHWCNYSFI